MTEIHLSHYQEANIHVKESQHYCIYCILCTYPRCMPDALIDKLSLISFISR